MDKCGLERWGCCDWFVSGGVVATVVVEVWSGGGCCCCRSGVGLVWPVVRTGSELLGYASVVDR